MNHQFQRNRRTRKLDGEGEAFLVASACSAVLESRKSWTLRLMADRLVECAIVDSISSEVVRRTQINELKSWLKDCWCIPLVSNLGDQSSPSFWEAISNLSTRSIIVSGDQHLRSGLVKQAKIRCVHLLFGFTSYFL